jgi:hypothetical protein
MKEEERLGVLPPLAAAPHQLAPEEVPRLRLNHNTRFSSKHKTCLSARIVRIIALIMLRNSWLAFQPKKLFPTTENVAT